MGGETGDDRVRATLAEFIAETLRSVEPEEAVDIEIEWPPSDELELTAWTGWLGPAEGWAPDDIGRVAIPLDDLGPGDVDPDDVFALLVAARKAVGGSAAVYARLHDSATSIDLASGEMVWDEDRPDWSPPPIEPHAPGPGRPPLDDSDGEQVRRGDSLTTARARLGIPESTKPRVLSPVLQVLERPDVRLLIQDGVVGAVTYLQSFTKKICGIWIGASPEDVVAVLGSPIHEFRAPPKRGWKLRHGVDGSHISVVFDEDDRVSNIGR